MKVYHHISEYVPDKAAVVTTGTFDGVHLGHQRIIRQLHETAEKIKGETVILTFFPHPRMVLFPNTEQLLLNTLDEKIALLEKMGVDHLVIHPFTREFSMLGSQEFIESILVKGLATKRLVIGYDHHFGKDREGSFENLKASGPNLGFEVEEIPAWEADHIKVSSTRIRQALGSGAVDVANLLLGYRYMLKGTVVKGQQLGRKLGYPTANIISTDAYKLVPGNGVYAVYVMSAGKRFGGMMNIGVRPTIDGTHRTAEVNIFDFDADIYGETIEVQFVKWVRGEQKFDGLDKRKQQLAADKTTVQKILEKEVNE
ncbi:MAG TPA: bifunctional riboflavin kinase/FAD synthetase [Bacteroidia bacterium]|nr:bifunctional riboflavin kinase/FAD synthetase [Bacteroidia bacterium]